MRFGDLTLINLCFQPFGVYGPQLTQQMCAKRVCLLIGGDGLLVRMLRLGGFPRHGCCSEVPRVTKSLGCALVELDLQALSHELCDQSQIFDRGACCCLSHAVHQARQVTSGSPGRFPREPFCLPNRSQHRAPCLLGQDSTSLLAQDGACTACGNLPPLHGHFWRLAPWRRHC